MLTREQKKYIKVIKEFYDRPYPPYIHESNLYDIADFFGTICMVFLKRPYKDIKFTLNIFNGANKEELEHNVMQINNEELNLYYRDMKRILRILKKYYNIDGTLKDVYK